MVRVFFFGVGGGGISSKDLKTIPILYLSAKILMSIRTGRQFEIKLFKFYNILYKFIGGIAMFNFLPRTKLITENSRINSEPILSILSDWAKDHMLYFVKIILKVWFKIKLIEIRKLKLHFNWLSCLFSSHRIFCFIINLSKKLV